MAFSRAHTFAKAVPHLTMTLILKYHDTDYHQNLVVVSVAHVSSLHKIL